MHDTKPEDTQIVSKKICITGIVQGIGFRPFIYQAAIKYEISGFVSNTLDGVTIAVQGKTQAIDTFVQYIIDHPPVHARIHDIKINTILPLKTNTFQIIDSQLSRNTSPAIPPDIATCQNCLIEMNDPSDRRFHYPFINCTHCGPRFTIVRDIPFDRHQTSMSQFSLCHVCQKEYINPFNRRFHAQAISCAACGPQAQLIARDQTVIRENPIQKAVALLHGGKILAIKGLGGFHLCVDATNDDAVCRLRKEKKRPDKPLAIMAANIDTIKGFAAVNSLEIEQLQSPQCPIVILKKKQHHRLSRHIASGETFGVMLPYTPLHHLLMTSFQGLIMTSGNTSDHPIVFDNDTAMKQLHFADYFLIHDRPIVNACDDSIVRIIDNQVHLYRRARGYVPEPIHLHVSLPKILAVGGHQKNTICLAHGKHAYVSQHLGDLSNVDTILRMKRAIHFWKRLTRIDPEHVACDMHPSYESTLIANELGLPVIPVGHHHAHVAACMAEQGLKGPLIGIVLDGTGYGSDQTVWGGEVLLCENHTAKRIAHLFQVPMPAGESAIKFPWKMALSWLRASFGDDGVQVFNQLNRGAIDNTSANVVNQIIQNKIHSPLTSSMGRLFDAISWMLGFTKPVTFEGQAAIVLETLASECTQVYDYTFCKSDLMIIDVRPMIRQIVSDILADLDISIISSKFHNTLVDIFYDLSYLLEKEWQINDIVLSGGVFQNKRLVSGMRNKFHKSNFRLSFPKSIPCNDGCISLGQAYLGGLIAGATAV
ncbi:MAG: hydrogenase maturation protein HypF [Candidatus Magnetoglobus multicellularis str. Araruama]|uniref:Carbamoyltransferase n=1 Tax=Candidatus Magnetoglobus multicellularis str. Araruama TaxID=890399 RepID=A0A1V1P1C9_9BACT|nr:MAG: hydrogenase maturation protein HypF [Candidatus Magnetoglobus multicellularis str. Araruama]